MANQGKTFEQLETAIRHGRFAPLYFWFGEEPFLIRELEELLIAHALAPHERDFNLDVIYGGEADARHVLALCRSFPMMAERRVVIVREVDRLKDRALLAEYARAPNPSAVVVLSCNGRPNLSVNPYRALKAQAEWAELAPLKPRELPGWIRRRLAQKGRDIAPDALQALVDLGDALDTLAQEIDKLVSYTEGRKTITRDDVLAVGGQGRAAHVFELQAAIGRGDYPAAMDLLERMLEQSPNRRGEALRVVAVLSTYFHRLWQLQVLRHRIRKPEALAREVGIRPWYLQEYLQALQHYPPGALERALMALLRADYALKGGYQETEALVLTRMLGEIMRPSRHRAA